MADHSIPQKHCTKCHRLLPETSEYFKPGKGYKNGLNSWCRECIREHRAKKEGWTKRRRPVPKAREGMKICSRCRIEFPMTPEYFGKDSRTKSGFNSCCRKCSYEYTKQYARNHREAYLNTKRAWRKANPDKVKNHKADSQRRHRAAANARTKRSQAKHPDVRRANTLNRIARKHKAEGRYTVADIHQMYEDQQGRCAYCGILITFDIPKDVHVDHVMPLSRGGSNWPDNLALTCQACNLSKGSKTLAEWWAVRGW